MLTTEQLIILVIFLLAYWIYSQQPQLKTTHQTQTDLTAEQIAQLEKDLETKKEELIKLVQEQKEHSKEHQQKQQELTALQTKYDLEVRSKEELAEELRLVRRYLCSEINLSDNFNRAEVEKLLKRFSPSKVVYYVGIDYVSSNKQINQDFTFLTEKTAPPRFAFFLLRKNVTLRAKFRARTYDEFRKYVSQENGGVFHEAIGEIRVIRKTEIPNSLLSMVELEVRN